MNIFIFDLPIALAKLDGIAINIKSATQAYIYTLSKLTNANVSDTIFQNSELDGKTICACETFGQFLNLCKKARQSDFVALWKLFAVVNHCKIYRKLPENKLITDWVTTKKPELAAAFAKHGVTAAMMSTLDPIAVAPIFDAYPAELQQLKEQYLLTSLL